MAALPEIRYEIGLVIRYKTSCYKEAAAGEGTKKRDGEACPSLRDLPARPFRVSASGILLEFSSPWSFDHGGGGQFQLSFSPKISVGPRASGQVAPDMPRRPLIPFHPRPLGTDLSDLTGRYSRPPPGDRLPHQSRRKRRPHYSGIQEEKRPACLR